MENYYRRDNDLLCIEIDCRRRQLKGRNRIQFLLLKFHWLLLSHHNLQ